jgi:hypothetical protein
MPGIVVGVDAGGVVHRHRRLVRGRIEHDLADRHAQVGRGVGHRVVLRDPQIGPVVTFGVTRSAGVTGLFMGMLPELADVAEETEDRADRDPHLRPPNSTPFGWSKTRRPNLMA